MNIDYPSLETKRFVSERDALVHHFYMKYFHSGPKSSVPTTLKLYDHSFLDSLSREVRAFISSHKLSDGGFVQRTEEDLINGTGLFSYSTQKREEIANCIYISQESALSLDLRWQESALREVLKMVKAFAV